MRASSLALLLVLTSTIPVEAKCRRGCYCDETKEECDARRAADKAEEKRIKEDERIREHDRKVTAKRAEKNQERYARDFRTRAWEDLLGLIKTAPCVQIHGDRDRRLESIVFEQDGRLECPRDRADERPLVLLMEEDYEQGSLGMPCTAFIFEVRRGGHGSPIMRGKGRQCYADGYENVERLRQIAFECALSDLHPPAGVRVTRPR